jgi:hypothetical protein
MLTENQIETILAAVMKSGNYYGVSRTEICVSWSPAAENPFVISYGDYEPEFVVRGNSVEEAYTNFLALFS